MTWKISQYWGLTKKETLQLNILEYLEYCEKTLELMYEEFTKSLV